VSIKKAMKFDFGERGGVINLPKITCALLFRVTVLFISANLFCKVL
jgi:hypothetical protein